MAGSWRRPISRATFFGITLAVAAVTTTATTVIVAGHRSGAPSVQFEVAEAAVVETTTSTVPVTVPITEAPTTTTTAAPIDLGENAQVFTADRGPAWVRQASAPCHCSAEFPWAPKVTNSSVSTGTAQLMLSDASSSAISVGLWSAPAASDAPTADDLRALLNYVGAPAGGATSSTGPKGVPAVDGRLTKNGDALARVFSLNGTDYVLLAATNDGSDARPTFERFVSSFQPA